MGAGYNPPTRDGDEWKAPGTAIVKHVVKKAVEAPVRAHTDFHAAVCALQDAMQEVFTTAMDSPDHPDAYAALSQRRKELYEWVAANTQAPATAYAVHLKF